MMQNNINFVGPSQQDNYWPTMIGFWLFVILIVATLMHFSQNYVSQTATVQRNASRLTLLSHAISSTDLLELQWNEENKALIFKKQFSRNVNGQYHDVFAYQIPFYNEKYVVIENGELITCSGSSLQIDGNEQRLVCHLDNSREIVLSKLSENHFWVNSSLKPLQVSRTDQVFHISEP